MELLIKNFKGINEEAHIQFRDNTVSVLVGPNNSGKTTILHAMLVSNDPFQQLGNAGVLVKIASTPLGPPVLSRLFYDPSKEAQVNDVTLKYKTYPDRVEVYYRGEIRGVVSSYASHTSLLYPFEAELENKLSPFNYRHDIFSDKMVREIWTPIDAKRKILFLSPTLKEEIYSTLRQMWHDVDKNIAVQLINSACVGTIGRIDEITLEPNENGDHELYVVKGHKRYPTSIYGDGVQWAIIALVMLSAGKYDTVLLDNVEAFMNPKLVGDFFGTIFDETLLEVLKGKTVVIATHSYDVLATLSTTLDDFDVFHFKLFDGKLEYKKMGKEEVEKLILDVRYPSTFNFV